MTTHRSMELNQPPAIADVYLVAGSSAQLTAQHLPAGTKLEFDSPAWAARTPVMDSGVARWRLSPQDVAGLANAQHVRLVADEQTIAAGRVYHVSEWPRWVTGGTQRITYVPGPTGPAGAAGVGISSITQPQPTQMRISLDDGNSYDLTLPGGGTAAPLTEEAIATALGYVLVTSEEPPTESTRWGVPIVWVPRRAYTVEVPVTPLQPSADLAARTITIPTVTGVEYLIDGQVVTGVWTASQDGVVTVTARALPGYLLVGPAQWQYTLGAPPPAGGLIAGDDFSGLDEGASLVPDGSPGLVGRAWPQQGSLTVNWSKWGSTKEPLVAASGGVTRQSNSGWAHADIGQADYLVELDLVPAATTHGSMISLVCGLGASRRGGVEFAIHGRTTGATIGGTQVTHLSQHDVTGTWRIRKRGGVLSIDAPNQPGIATVSKEVTPDWGNVLQLRVTLAGLVRGIRVFQ
ncbi:MAG: hypothetical protein Q4B08_11910 [Propionibacteriaceae bacterium]|nr:hypothetical protein [Propionibacteriaceae bacterium]